MAHPMNWMLVNWNIDQSIDILLEDYAIVEIVHRVSITSVANVFEMSSKNVDEQSIKVVVKHFDWGGVHQGGTPYPHQIVVEGGSKIWFPEVTESTLYEFLQF